MSYIRKNQKRACEFIPKFLRAKIYPESLAEQSVIIKGKFPDKIQRTNPVAEPRKSSDDLLWMQTSHRKKFIGTYL